MDRLSQTLAACGLSLGLLTTASGCRSTRSEVPPGRPFANDGKQRPAIDFSSQGHPASAAASTNFMPNNVGGSNLASGIGAGTRPDASSFGAPPAAYGAPGTSGLGQPPSLKPGPAEPATMPAAMEPSAQSPPALVAPPSAAAPTPEADLTPPPLTSPAPNPIIQAPSTTPGTMGRPDQFPSPN